jgi:O-antigen/teichoic acid export membrane protein
MGVIQRQATKSSIVSWIGVFLGIFNVLFIVPNVLETYGIYTFIISAVTMAASVFTLGMNVGVIRFFNEFDDGKESNRSFLVLGLGAVFLGFTVFCLLAWIFKDQIVDFYKTREPEKYQYLIMVIPILLVTMLFSVTSYYISNFKRIVIPNILRHSIKFFLPLALICYWQEWVDNWGFLYLILLFNTVIAGALFVYLKQLGELKFVWVKSIFTKPRVKEMCKYMLNGIFLSLGSVLASLIDTIMVGSMIDIGETTAIYSIGAVISNILIMPNQAVAGISNPIISNYWSTNNIKDLQTLYQKASVNLVAVGLLLFIGIWVSIDDVFSIMKNGETISAAKGVILYLGLARLFSMLCGINGMVLNLSPKYAYGTVSILFMAVLNIFTNYYFIKEFAMVGAAMGTAISIFLFNFFIVTILYYFYRINPFHYKSFFAIIVAVIVAFFALRIDLGNPYFNILIKSLFTTITYVLLIYYLKISPDINGLIVKYFHIAKSWLKG